MDWFDRLERFVVERRTLSAVLTIALIGVVWLLVWIPRGIASVSRELEDQSRKVQADQKAIAEHQKWLESLPVEEKRKWRFSVCRPGSRADGKCDCGDFETRFYGMGAFAEVLPNGDIACHLTK